MAEGNDQYPGKGKRKVIERGGKEKRLIVTLEKDPEFRYSLMGLLGFKEILDRIISLEERFASLEEKFLELEQKFAKLEEGQLRSEECQQRLEERMVRLEERVTRVEERLEQLERAIITIGNRFGVLSENVFRDAMKGIVEEYLRGK